MILTDSVEAHVYIDCDKCAGVWECWMAGGSVEDCEQEAMEMAVDDGWLITDDQCLCPQCAPKKEPGDIALAPGFNRNGTLLDLSFVYGYDWRVMLITIFSKGTRT